MVRIVRPNEIESLGRGGDTTQGTVTHSQEVCGPMNRGIAPTDRNQDADDVSDHMVQKPVGPDAQIDKPISLLELQIMDSPDRALGLAGQGPEAAEVVLAYQRRCGVAHTLQVQRLVYPKRTATLQGRAGALRKDAVAVMTGRGGIAGMEGVGHRMGPAHRAIGREIDICAQDPSPFGTAGPSFEMDNLLNGMHPRVRASGTVYDHGMIGD